MLLEYQDATPAALDGMVFVGGIQNLQQRSRNGSLRRQRRKLIYWNRFSLASLGGGCAPKPDPCGW